MKPTAACKPTFTASRRRVLPALGGAVLGLVLVGCSSGTVAAPVTSKVTTLLTSSVTVQVTVSQIATETATETVTEVVEPPISVQLLTVTEPLPAQTKIVTKPAPPAITKVVTEPAPAPVTKIATVTVTADAPAASGDSGDGGSAAAGSGSSFSDGTELVGTDVQPGTYRAPGGSDCYWERLKGASGSNDDIIANDLGPVNPVVEISSSDYAFTSSNCGNWTKIG